MGADGAVAEDEVDLVGARDAEAVELVDICRELHKRRDAGGAGELGVLHAPTTVVFAQQEVGEPDELVSGERGLEQQPGI